MPIYKTKVTYDLLDEFYILNHCYVLALRKTRYIFSYVSLFFTFPGAHPFYNNTSFLFNVLDQGFSDVFREYGNETVA